MRLFPGQSNWQPGQLECELAANYWLATPGDPEAVFTGRTGHLWETLINRLDPFGIVAQR